MSQLTEQIHSSEIGDILENSLNGNLPTQDDCLRLIRSDDTFLMGMTAGHLTRKKFGTRASFVNNIILNYTNVCITDCKFCAFYRPPGNDESYTLTLDEIEARIKTGWDMFKIRQVLIQGGHNPDLGIEYYEDSFKMIRKKFPEVGVHGLSTSEIDMIAKVEKSSTMEVLSDEWLRIMDEAFSLGLPASATMMYGHVESDNDIVEHFSKIIELQKKTNGFMAFIPWSFEPNNTLMQHDGTVTHGAGGIQLLKMIAISRIVFDGLIDHIQSSWLTNGVGMAQLALQYGADDFGGTLIGEEVVSCTGSRSTELTDKRIIESIKQIGYSVEERDNFYNRVCLR